MTRARSEIIAGDLPIDAFVLRPKPSSMTGELQKLFGRFVISPMFLIAFLLVLYFVPENLLRVDKRSKFVRGLEDRLDRGMDIAISSISLLLLSPLFFLVGVLIKIESEGAIFYRQERVGKNHRDNHTRIWLNLGRSPAMKERRNGNLCGKPFKLYKFRTMTNDAELHTGPVWAKTEDPRVTRIGKWLRSVYIDEIPQLINVLKGEMSLVGPRPERPYFTRQLAARISGYSDRFAVKPGITGLAQVKRYADSSIEDVRKKTKYDVLYCKKRSLLLKIGIVIMTAGWALKRGAASREI